MTGPRILLSRVSLCGLFRSQVSFSYFENTPTALLMLQNCFAFNFFFHVNVFELFSTNVLYCILALTQDLINHFFESPLFSVAATNTSPERKPLSLALRGSLGEKSRALIPVCVHCLLNPVAE